MPSILTVQVNPTENLSIIKLPVPGTSDLVYTKGGGTLFPVLKDDLIEGGKQWHGGNPLSPITIQLKSCENIRVTNSTLKTTSGKITRGLFTTNQNNLVWDEVFTTPMGQYIAKAGTTPTLGSYEFKFFGDNSEELYISTNDVNIIPKAGDYLIIQKARNILISNTFNTDGYSDWAVDTLAETWQFKLTEVTVNTVGGAGTVYKIILDKSFAPLINEAYNFILLNRENTGIQKELFYDTFEQIEVHKSQLLGDSYNNIANTALPSGRKNYLNYNRAQYLGVRTLLNKIINNTNTPVMIYDIANDIKDRFNPVVGEFEFVLPFVMIQKDTRVSPTNLKPNKIIDAGTVFNASTSIGKYAGLYFDWDTTFSYRVGWIFYDLRIFALDDSELVYALSYNSNRNYTLPKPKLSTNFGNSLKNPGGGIDIEIVDVTNTSPIVVTTATAHNLAQGTPVFISDVYVQGVGNNTVSSNANGINYVKLVYPNGTSQPPDPNKFELWDATLTVPTTGNGVFILNPSGSSGRVMGTLPEYSYFFTYRLVGSHYQSILPYSQTTDFNFALNGAVDTSANAQLKIDIEPIKFLIDNTNTIGFEAIDLEIIIGKYLNSNPVQPNKVTGFDSVVTIPLSELTFPRVLFSTLTGDQANLQNIIITKQDYDNFVAKIGGIGPFDKVSNTTGDPSYNVFDNYNHYNLVDSSLPATLVTAEGKWTLGNVSYKNQSERYVSSIDVVVPANKWNDTTNPTYDPTNPFIKERYISEIGLVISENGVEKPMIYAKVAPAVKKTNLLDIILSLNLHW